MVSAVPGSGAGLDGSSKIRVTILGATGSVGQSALKVIDAHRDKFEVVGLVSRNNWRALAQAAKSFEAAHVGLAEVVYEGDLDSALEQTDTQTHFALDGIKQVLDQPTDVIVAAIVGAQGLEPTLYAMQSGRRLALANKECLVSAGPLFMKTARDNNITLLPIDSEHNALFQCLVGHKHEEIESLVITASGGPFLNTPLEALKSVTAQDALKHPVWEMGAKISIDSATMMNKGLELIEAHYLFDTSVDMLSALIHPQSTIHGMVHYKDGSVLAHLGVPDMQVPIAHCLGWPDRLKLNVARLDLAQLGQLSFSRPDKDRFLCFELAQQALRTSPAATNAMNAANEIAVQGFLSHQIGFTDIGHVSQIVMRQMAQAGELKVQTDLNAIMMQDRQARDRAHHLLQAGFSS